MSGSAAPVVGRVDTRALQRLMISVRLNVTHSWSMRTAFTLDPIDRRKRGVIPKGTALASGSRLVDSALSSGRQIAGLIDEHAVPLLTIGERQHQVGAEKVRGEQFAFEVEGPPADSSSRRVVRFSHFD